MSAVTFAIRFHEASLKQLLAMLLVYAGLTDENDQVRSPAEMRRFASEPFTLSRRFLDMALKLLVPVESATRRLIVLIASQLPEEERRAARLTTSTPTSDLSPQGGGEPAPDCGASRALAEHDAAAAISPPPLWGGVRGGGGSGGNTVGR